MREIAREVGVSLKTVQNIVHKDIRLKCLKKKRAQQLTEANMLTRLVRSRQLLREYPQSKVHFIWFTDEKLFTVAAPNNAQNDRLYVALGAKRSKFQQHDYSAHDPPSPSL